MALDDYPGLVESGSWENAIRALEEADAFRDKPQPTDGGLRICGACGHSRMLPARQRAQGLEHCPCTVR